MSTQQKRGLAAEGISEEAVAHYLQTHPDFFERHGGLLTSLRLPHQVGQTVSLIERQVSILRQRNGKLDRKLQELLSVAKANDQLAARIHTLARKLITAGDFDAVLTALERTLREEFGAEFRVLVLFGPARGSLPGFLRWSDIKEPALEPFRGFLEHGGARCGRITDPQREFLFDRDSNAVGSAAMVALGGPARVGILAVGSQAADRFVPTMSTDFLVRIGELVSEALNAKPR